ncbi:hypothetical protein [Flavobacterium sp.]|uniref:hypothetical protein n=1 Tax=Flavobacterium sp. TaxID=239 RepID=UPI00404757A7
MDKNKFINFIELIESKKLNDSSQSYLLSNALDYRVGSGTTNTTCSNSGSSCSSSINRRCTNSSESDCSNSMNRKKCLTPTLQQI